MSSNFTFETQLLGGSRFTDQETLIELRIGVKLRCAA